MDIIQFKDHIIPYDRFLNDVAAKVVSFLKNDNNDPEYVSQRKAYSIFGRRNVERWRRERKIEPIKRPGKIEYKTSELRLLQRTIQDYH
jgi:hypothetical protein